MNILETLTFWNQKRNPARELSLIGHEKRRQDVRAVARQIRDELGLSDDSRLA